MDRDYLTSIIMTIFAILANMFFPDTSLTLAILGITIGLSWAVLINSDFVQAILPAPCDRLTPSIFGLSFGILTSFGFATADDDWFLEAVSEAIPHLSLFLIFSIIGFVFGYRLGCQIGIFAESDNLIVRWFFRLLFVQGVMVFLIISYIAFNLLGVLFILATLISAIITHRYCRKMISSPSRTLSAAFLLSFFVLQIIAIPALTRIDWFIGLK